MRGLPLFVGCILVLASPDRVRASQEREEEIAAHLRALDSEDEAARAAAIDALAKRGKRTAETLIKELQSSAATGRTKTGVIEVLGKMKGTGKQLLEDALMEQIHAASIPRITATCSAIGHAGAKAAWAAPLLIERIEKGFDRGFPDANNMVICSAIMALGQLGPTGARSHAIVRKYLEDPALEVRLSSACASWWMGGEVDEAYGILLQGLEVPSQTVALERAIFGLGEMGPRATAALPKLEALRSVVLDQTKVTISEAVRKIEGKLPPVCARPSSPGAK